MELMTSDHSAFVDGMTFPRRSATGRKLMWTSMMYSTRGSTRGTGFGERGRSAQQPAASRSGRCRPVRTTPISRRRTRSSQFRRLARSWGPFRLRHSACIDNEGPRMANTHLNNRYLEDIQAGERFRSADYAVTEAEIIEYAKQYDPQPFHTNPVEARNSVFGGLVASGWFTAAI